MGCFQSKNNKNKTKPLKIPKLNLGQNNIKWKRLLQNPIAIQLIIDNINGVAEHPAYKAIDKDVCRTFPKEQFFSNQKNLQLFKQTLKCFALTFPKVGYTQGLNFLAGFFLLNRMKKSQCLNILTSVSTHSQLMCLGLYQDEFPLVYLYCQIFWRLLKKLDQQLYDCIKLIGIPDHMWIFQWYITFFLYSFPLQYVSLYFNSIFEYKQFEMVKLSLGIVLSLKQDILRLPQKDDISFLEFLQNLKDIQTCMKMLNIQDSLQKAHIITNFQIQECMKDIQKDKSLDNFYFQYFFAQNKQKKNLYSKFIQEIEDKKVQLSNSKHDQKLMQSFKRNASTVQILDQILQQSIKRQLNKKYKSNLIETRKNSNNKNSSFRKWKSLAHLQEEPQNQAQGQTTVSVVKKVIIPEDKDQ